MVSSPHEAISLSRSALLLGPCTAWSQPEAVWYDTAYDPESKRDRGTEVHRLIHEEVCYQKATTDPVAKHALSWLNDQVFSNRLTHVQSEVAVSVNWSEDKAEVLKVENRQYPQRAGWQNGTADIVARYGLNGLYVGDWKTGEGVGWEEQVLSLLYALLKAFEGQGLEEPTEFIGACLKVNESGCWPIEKVYTRQDLDLHADAMRLRWEDIQTNNGNKPTEYVPGIHCTQYYCPHLAYCPAIKGYVKELAMKDDKYHLSTAQELKLNDKPATDFEAGETVEILAAVKRQLKYFDEQMKAYVKKGGRVISGAFEWCDRGAGYRWGKMK